MRSFSWKCVPETYLLLLRIHSLGGAVARATTMHVRIAHPEKWLWRGKPPLKVSRESAVSLSNSIKSATRSRLAPTALNNLLLLTIEGPAMDDMDFDAVTDAWGKARRLRVI